MKSCSAVTTLSVHLLGSSLVSFTLYRESYRILVLLHVLVVVSISSIHHVKLFTRRLLLSFTGAPVPCRLELMGF